MCPGAAAALDHRLTGWLRTTDSCSLMLLEARNLKSRVGRSDSLQRFKGRILPVLGDAKHSLACGCIIPSSASSFRDVFPPCVAYKDGYSSKDVRLPQTIPDDLTSRSSQ